MVDSLTRVERSRRMSLIRSSNTLPELAVRRALHRRGLRFRLGNKQLAGKPDLVFPKYHTVLFVHGCFWHRHLGCKIASTPKSNEIFWQTKFEMNIRRDARVQDALRTLGWNVFVVWECQISQKKIEATADELYKSITSRCMVKCVGSSS